MNGNGKQKLFGFSTKAIHAGEQPNLKDGGTGDVVKPIHLSTTFARKRLDQPTAGYEYSRTGNPTRNALEEKLASLENVQYALAFSSGMAAETILALTLLNSGDHVVAFNDLYGGTRRLFETTLRQKYQIEFSYVDARKPENVEKAIRKNTKLIWLETPTNPLMRICNIAAISKVKKNKNIALAVDNTFLSPYFQNPIDHGADIVVHSATKYLGGHSDAVGGALMIKQKATYEKLKFNQNATGAILSPFDSYMIMRGIKTLAVRMEKHNDNAMQVAEFLESNPKISNVYYPGLKSHPQHTLTKNQTKGYGGVLSFEIRGTINHAKQFLQNLRLFYLAESLGGVESLIEHPASMTHASIPKEIREQIGIKDNLIRASVGLEDLEDLLTDLNKALKKT
jgi:cystathionine gamma-lyase